MKIQIDTEKKTIQVLGNVLFDELVELVYKAGIDNFNLVGHEVQFKPPWSSLPPQEPCAPPKFGDLPYDAEDTGRPSLKW